VISQSIATRGHHLQRRERPASPPGRSCIQLQAVLPTGLRFSVIPPTDLDYAGTKIQYNIPGICGGYAEAGPEVAGMVTITGLVAGRIYAFVPWAYDATGSYSKPGDVILATWPINIIDMDGLQLNSCSLEAIWQLISRKPDRNEMTRAMMNLDQQVMLLTNERDSLRTRATVLEAELAALRRKVSGG